MSGAGPRWSLRLLDGWQLLRDDRTVRVSSREQRILSLVALCGEQPRSRLATLLWPDSVESRAHGNLRTAVWRIQHQQGGVLDEERGTVRVSARTHVDVDELRRVAHQVSVDGSPSARALTVLCHGALLPGWDEEWVVEQREVLRHVRLRALEDLARHLLDRGDATGALEAAMLAVTVDPLRESSQRALIRVHLHQGNTVDAVRIYRRFRRRLAEELGVSVSSQIVDLVRPLQVRSTQLRHPATERRTATAAPPTLRSVPG